MSKLKMHSPNLVDSNIEKIAELFPNCITEIRGENGELSKGVDFDLLRQELSEILVDGPLERYRLDWPGKKEAILAANAPIAKTLRPCREESVSFDTTENLFIEGDNLDALKLLQENYLGKVKMIYIDPPYNTGNDFIYEDDFAESVDEFLERSNQFDEEGNRLVANTESNGRFHSDWLSMMYSRLKLARNLLSDEGVIFISIDDNEQANLKRICDEVFGERNFIAELIWERAYAPVNLKKHFSENHDFILVYAKNIADLVCNGLPRTEEANSRYMNPDNDPRGVWKSSDLSVGPAIESNIYEIMTPAGRLVSPPSGYSWRLNQERFFEFVRDNRIWFGEQGSNVPSIKRFLSEVSTGLTPMTIWKYKDVGHSQSASQALKALFDGKAYFTYPKPVPLIKQALNLYSNSDSIILDFFAGSSTTAHAVMQQNTEDGGNRKFIMVQLPEVTDEKSEAYKAGYPTIAEISKERIRRAGAKILADNADKEGIENLDIGFRVLKVDSSNMKDVYYKPELLEQADLLDLADNIKDDRSAEDLLFQVMVDEGIELSLPIECKEILGQSVYYVAGNSLVACFDSLSLALVDEVAKDQPLLFVSAERSIQADQDKRNIKERFKQLSSKTDVKFI